MLLIYEGILTVPLDAILTNNPSQNLLFIHFWNDWEAVTLDKNTEECVAWKWNGKAFTKAEISSAFCREPRYPLGNIFKSVKVGYYEATDLAKSLIEDINKASIKNFNEQLTAININNEIRPVWVLPFPKDGQDLVGVLADNGKIIKRLKFVNYGDSTWSLFWKPKLELREVHETGWYGLLKHIVADNTFLFIVMGFFGVSLIFTAISLGRGIFIGAACIQIGLITAATGASIDATVVAIIIVFLILFIIFFLIAALSLSMLSQKSTNS